jgi:hypothetical protein
VIAKDMWIISRVVGREIGSSLESIGACWLSSKKFIRACLGELHAAPDPQKQLHSIFFLPNTLAPKTPDPPNPWI